MLFVDRASYIPSNRLTSRGVTGMKIIKLLDNDLFLGLVLGIAAGHYFGAKLDPYHTFIMGLGGVVVVKFVLDLVKAK